MTQAEAFSRDERDSGWRFRPHSEPAPVDVSIVIPTFRRPGSLARALRSCQRQVGAPASEVVVVDNCPQRSASGVVAELALGSPIPIRYEHEPVAGVAAARNRGVAAANAHLVAFLDDDEEADEHWLARLVETRTAHDSDAVFGAVVARIDGPAPPEAEVFRRMLTRHFVEPAGELPPRRHAALGTGNSLFHKRCLGERPFDPALGLGGGEDSALIKSLARRRHRFAWTPDARVTEYLPSRRANLPSMLRRRFSDGQVRTSTCVVAQPREPLRALFWMFVGVAQLLVCSLMAAGAALVQRKATWRLLCSASSGLGKVLWMPPFRALRYPQQRERDRPESD